MTCGVPEKYLAASYCVFFKSGRQKVTFWGGKTLTILKLAEIPVILGNHVTHKDAF